MKLILKNNLTKKEIEFNGIPVYSVNMIGYEVGIELPSGVLDGEYTYYLIDDGQTIGQGLLQIGDYVEDAKQYNEKKKVIVYGK